MAFKRIPKDGLARSKYDLEQVEKDNGKVTTADTDESVVRNITISTSSPTGGDDGDVWLVYTA